MYKDDIKLFTKHGKELKILIQALIIYSQDIEMESDIEKYVMLIMRTGEQHIKNQQKFITLGEK